MRWLLGLALMVFAVAAPLLARADAPEALYPDAPWQGVIEVQLDAFRAGDGATALSFAGAGFKAAYADPNLFYAAIVGSGYGPLVMSRSHTFGEFQRLGEDTVMQVVNLIGPDQKLYQAVYRMLQEAEGWRVQGVTLKPQEGMGV